MHLKDDVLAAAELVIGNLSEDGYLLATDDELLAVADPSTPGMESANGGNGLAKGAAEVLRTLAEETIASPAQCDCARQNLPENGRTAEQAGDSVALTVRT